MASQNALQTIGFEFPIFSLPQKQLFPAVNADKYRISTNCSGHADQSAIELRQYLMAGKASPAAGRGLTKQFEEQFVSSKLMVMGNIIENCRKCSYPQGVVIGDGNVVFALFFRRKPQVDSTLTGDL